MKAAQVARVLRVPGVLLTPSLTSAYGEMQCRKWGNIWVELVPTDLLNFEKEWASLA